MKELAHQRSSKNAKLESVGALQYNATGVVLFADLAGFTDLSTQLGEVAKEMADGLKNADRRGVDYLVGVDCLYILTC